MPDRQTTAKPTARAAAKAAQARAAARRWRRRSTPGTASTGSALMTWARGPGISAPAVYRHFSSKEAVLEELLVGISEYLQSRRARRSSPQSVAPAPTGASPAATPAGPDPSPPHRLPRRLRDERARTHSHSGPRPCGPAGRVRGGPSGACSAPMSAGGPRSSTAAHPGWSLEAATVRVHAVFGMMNSTPHQARRSSAEVVEVELRAAAAAALAARLNLTGSAEPRSGDLSTTEDGHPMVRAR
jgi:AcrR family transcriptional regulator